MLTLTMKSRRQVIANLSRFDRSLFDSLLRTVNSSLQDVAQRARSMAPVDTGKLKGAITVRPAGRGNMGRFYGSVVATGEYSAWVEFGAGRGRGKKKSKARRWALASRVGSINRAAKMGLVATYKQPFLGPAFVEQRPKFLLKIQYQIEEAAAQAAARAHGA